MRFSIENTAYFPLFLPDGARKTKAIITPLLFTRLKLT
jgi:hypothetical protein